MSKEKTRRGRDSNPRSTTRLGLSASTYENGYAKTSPDTGARYALRLCYAKRPQATEWQGIGKVALCWSASATMPQFAAKADRTRARNSSPHSGLMKKAAAPAAKAFQRTIRSSFAVRTMTLVEGEIPLSRLWTSKPSIRGIHISITTTLG
jgi:hypothetical protein